MSNDIARTTNIINEQKAIIDGVRQEVNKVLVGQERLLDRMLIALISNGHILLEGVPDLLPADVIGTMIYNPREGTFTPRLGPIFTNLLLADEINRAPAKVQSALLEAMQEHQVTIGDKTYPLPEPFMVMATQNPLEQEGTYPLPEAQIDRFMLKCRVDYPSKDDERRIMNRFSRKTDITLNPVMSGEQILAMRDILDQVYCDEKVADYILDIVFATRKPADYKLDIGHHIQYGGSPRASLFLNIAARANALLHGRAYATPQDIKEIAYDVLRHRLILTYEAEAENLKSEDIIAKILGEIPVP